MSEVVIVDSVRSAVGKRRGGLSAMHPTDLFADVLAGLIDRVGVDSAMVGQVTGGCVSQVGPQAGNVTRNAWLTAGLAESVAGSTVHAQCGSAQQAFTLSYGLVAGGLVDVAVAGGVEVMSTVSMLAPAMPQLGPIRSARYEKRYEITSQFEGSDRIAAMWGFSRTQLDEFALQSHERASAAQSAGHFANQIVPVDAPVVDFEGLVDGHRTITADEGPRASTLGGLASLTPNRGDAPNALHTAGTSSQVSDGASALMMMNRIRADELGVRPRARIVDSVLVGSDPVLMLTGPIPATQQILARTGLTMADMDVVEVNEAFAAVVLAWAQEMKSDLSNVNVNGGAISLGHPLGATGVVLVTKALHELERLGGRYALVTMCVGGGMGTATIIERV